MEVFQSKDFAGVCASLGPQSLANRRHSTDTPECWMKEEEQKPQCWGGGGHWFLPLELAKQDEVGGRAREGGGAPDAGRVGDGDEEALPDVPAIFLLLLGVSLEIHWSLRLLRTVFALNKPKEKPFRRHSEFLALWGNTLPRTGELSELSRRQLAQAPKTSKNVQPFSLSVLL